MQETYGKGPFTTCPEKTSFGLNMHTCNKFWVSLKRPGTSSGDGWNGCPEKRLGWGTLSLSNEWENHKKQEMFFINTLRQVQIWPLTSKQQSFNLRTVTSKQQEKYSKESQLIWVHKLLTSRILLNLVNLKSSSTNTTGQGKF